MLTATSTFSSLTLLFDVFSGRVYEISYTLSDGTGASLSFNAGVVATADSAKLEILKEIYVGGGFLNDSGDATPVTITPDHAPQTLAGLPRLPAQFGNPFLSEAQDADDNSGLTNLGNRFYRMRAYQQAATKPAPPNGNWWNDDGVFNLGSWGQARHSQVDPNSALPVWIALDAVSLDEDDNETYNGWDIIQEFDVEYSADGTSWHAVQADDDRYFGFLTPDGTRRVVETGEFLGFDWTQIYEGTPYNANHSAVATFGVTVNLDLYQRLRFRFQPFGYWASGSRGNVGANADFILEKPITGWDSGEISSSDEGGTFSWYYDDIEGLTVLFHSGGSQGNIVVPDGIRRSGADTNGNSYPARRIAGKGKFTSTDITTPHLVQGLILYGFGAHTSYERFELIIEGSTF